MNNGDGGYLRVASSGNRHLFDVVSRRRRRSCVRQKQNSHSKESRDSERERETISFSPSVVVVVVVECFGIHTLSFELCAVCGANGDDNRRSGSR